MAANNIYIQVDLNSSSAQQNVNALNQAIASTGPTAEKSSKQTTQALSTVQVSVQQTTRAFAELTTALAGLGLTRMLAGVIQTASEYSRARQAITLFAGSAEEARKVIEQVRIIAAQSPFHFRELQETARELLAFGMNAKQVPTVIRAITDQVAAMGGTIEDVNSIVTLFGRIMEKNVVGAMDIMRKLPAEGVPVMKAFQAELEKSLKIPIAKGDVQQAIKEGLFEPMQTIRVLTENMGRTGFGKMLDDASLAFKNLGDAAESAFAELFGPEGFGPAFAKLAGDIEKVLAPIGGLIKALEALDEPTKDAIVKWGAIGAAVLAAATAFAALAAIFTPLIGVIAGLIGLLPEILTVVGGIAGIGTILYKTVPQVKTFVDGLKGQFDELVAKGKGFTDALNKIFHPDKIAAGNIIDPEKQEELFQKLLAEVQKTATTAQQTLLKALASPVEAVEIKYTQLFADLQDKIKFLTTGQQQAIKDALESGKTAEIEAARFKKQQTMIDESAKYEIQKTKGSYDAQIAYIEALDEQDLRKKVAGIDRITQLRVESAETVKRLEYQRLQDTFDQQKAALNAHRDEWVKAGLNVDQAIEDRRQEMLAKQKVINEKAMDEEQVYRLQGWKKANDAIIEDQKRVFDNFKSLFDQIFDALTGKSKDIGKAIADIFKKELLGEARNIFSTELGQIATQAAGYGQPEAQIARSGGILTTLLMRGMPPRAPMAPPDIYTPARASSTVGFDGQGEANRMAQLTGPEPRIALGPVSVPIAGADFPAFMAPGYPLPPAEAYAPGVPGAYGPPPPAVGMPDFASQAAQAQQALASLGMAGIIGPGGTAPFAGGGAAAATTRAGVNLAANWAKTIANLKQSFGIGTAAGQGADLPGTTTFGSVASSQGMASLYMAAGMPLAMAGIFGTRQGTAGGMLESTLGGAGIGAGIGTMILPGFGTALGAGIGAAAGLGIGLGEMLAGVESPRNKVKRLASQLYHININNATADAIANLAQQSFGGNVGVAMRSPQVRQMLGVYAAGTGQANQFPAGLDQAHGASLVEAGGMLQQQATYQYGNPYTYSSNLPVYGGQPTHVLSAPGGGMQLSLNIGGQDAASFLAGNVVSPSMVQQQYATAMQNSNGRVPQALMMSEPGTIVS
ncbi:MAG TPA: tape measure protein [Pseudolabrys sp.]|jgi:hypothetical protein|nr:tape measure protein [Pseudolabrys sp.]